MAAWPSGSLLVSATLRGSATDTPLANPTLLRRFLPSAWSSEIPDSEGNPKASEEHRPTDKEEPLWPPGKRDMH